MLVLFSRNSTCKENRLKPHRHFDRCVTLTVLQTNRIPLHASSHWWGNSSNDRTDIKASVSVKISIDLGFIRSHTSFCLWLLRYFLKSPPSISSSISNSSPRGSDVIPKQRTMFLWSNLLCERDTYIPYILLQTVKLSNYFFYSKQDTCTNKGKFGNKLSIFSFDIKGSCFSDKWNEKFNCRKHKLIL